MQNLLFFFSRFLNTGERDYSRDGTFLQSLGNNLTET